MEQFEEMIDRIYVEEQGLVVTSRIREGMLRALKLLDEPDNLESFLRKESTIEYVGSHQPFLDVVPEEVSEHVRQYLTSELPQYHLIEICRHSNHPDDRHLYSVIAMHQDGTYACWTSWDDSTKSLNHGHYRLDSLKSAEKIVKDNFYDMTDEPEKYGFENTINSKERSPERLKVENMTRTFEINGRKVEFTEVTAVWHKEPEAGRREAILIHDTTDEFHDGDGIVFEAHMPENGEDAENLLSETIETYYETLDTIETVEAEEMKKEIDSNEIEFRHNQRGR